ncbi:MAG: NAD(P)/FAD-dependent oxidoreductase [Candidatus Asgardarchaeia archaeon]
MKRKSEVVIIGAGVTGLGIAYQLAKRGFTDVVVVEQKYPSYGASGRNAGGVRQQWDTEENIILARESVKMFKKLPQELGWNFFFRQTGYLILAFTEEEVERYKRNIKLQNKLGVPSRWVSPEKAKEIAPAIDESKILGAAYNPTDGVLHPIGLVYGYWRKVKEMGVDVYTYTKVTGIKVENGKVKGVITDKGEIETKIVVNAAGGYSRYIAEMAGVELPNQPYRREIMVSEPLKPIINPMIISFHHGIYITQTSRGEIIGGWGDPNEKPGINLRSSPGWLEKFAKLAVSILPDIRYVKVLRQWAGVYDITPDHRPILGEVDEVEGFIQANGYSGHGVMISPMVTKLIAELIIDHKTSIPIDSLNLRRFKEGEVKEEHMVV